MSKMDPIFNSEKEKSLKKIWIILLFFVTLALFLTLFFGGSTKILVVEGGFWELFEAFSLIYSALLLAWGTSRYLWKKDTRKSALLSYIFALLLFMGGGEELNWGQHYYGFKTPSNIALLNKDHQFNLHDMTVFSQKMSHPTNTLLIFFNIIYFIALPTLAYFFPRRFKYLNDISFPLASRIFIPFALLVLYMPSLPFHPSSLWSVSEMEESLVSAMLMGAISLNVRRWKVHNSRVKGSLS